MSIPTPNTVAAFARKAAIPAPPAAPRLLVAAQPTDPGKRVTLGVRDEIIESLHDGVVKTKHLRRGERVRPWVKGEPRGSERIIAKVEKIEDGAEWLVTFASAHPATTYKAAYRWFSEALVGTTVQHVAKVPAFVPAHD